MKEPYHAELSPFLINTVWEVLVSKIIQGKEKEGMQIEEEEIKLSLVRDGMIAYIKSEGNYKENTRMN